MIIDQILFYIDVIKKSINLKKDFSVSNPIYKIQLIFKLYGTLHYGNHCKLMNAINFLHSANYVEINDSVRLASSRAPFKARTNLGGKKSVDQKENH